MSTGSLVNEKRSPEMPPVAATNPAEPAPAAPSAPFPPMPSLHEVNFDLQVRYNALLLADQLLKVAPVMEKALCVRMRIEASELIGKFVVPQAPCVVPEAPKP